MHSLHASLTIDTRQPWKRRPNIETDSYVIIAAATPWSEIVQTALQRLGYSQEVANTARGEWEGGGAGERVEGEQVVIFNAHFRLSYHQALETHTSGTDLR